MEKLLFEGFGITLAADGFVAVLVAGVITVIYLLRLRRD